MTNTGGGRFTRDRGESSIGKTYVASQGPLKKFIRRLCANDADVDDIAQEAFVNAMDAEASREIESPKAYLYQVARNLAIRTHRKKSREIIDYVESLQLEQEASPQPSVEDHVISRERLGALCDAISTLPPSCRRVFVMRKVYGYSHKEIASRLGISTSTVEKHLATGFARCVTFMRNQDSGQTEQAWSDHGSDRNEAAAQNR